MDHNISSEAAVERSTPDVRPVEKVDVPRTPVSAPAPLIEVDEHAALEDAVARTFVVNLTLQNTESDEPQEDV